MVYLVPADVIQVFANGSSSHEDVEGEIFSEQLNLILSVVLANYCRTIQAEVMIIKIAAAENLYHSISCGDISHRFLANVYITLIIVQECRMTLQVIVKHST